MNKDQKIAVARKMVSPALYRFFQAEWANEHDGGVSPATVSSAIDSLVQAPEVFNLTVGDVAHLALIRDLVSGSTRLYDLAKDDGATALAFAAKEG